MLLKILPSLCGIVFRKFNCFSYGPVTTGDKPDHKSLWHSVSRRTLTGINDPKSSAGAGTYIKKTAAFFHLPDDPVHQLFNFRGFFLYSNGNCPILRIDME